MLLLAALLIAQAKPTPPAVPKNFPTLTTPATLGAAPGETVTLTLTGTNLAKPTGVWTSFPAKTTVKPKDDKSVTATFAIPADTPIGLHTVRVATEVGISNFQPFVVDDLKVTPETTGKSKLIEAAQEIPVPGVVTGVAEAESSDYFRFPVKAGEPVTIEVLARRLGSAMDPVIILRDGDGKELGGVYADDTPGLQSDCRLVYTPDASGERIVELRDSIYGGSGGHTYRLRVGRFPGATTAFPLAVGRADTKPETVPIGFAGPDVSGAKAVPTPAPTDPAVSVVYATPRAGKSAGWPVPVRVSDRPETVEAEPNNDAKSANKLAVPGGISGVFATKSDIDTFTIAAKKGKKLAIQVLTYEVNSPAEVYLRVLDTEGKVLAKSDPTKAVLKLDFDPPADGDYQIACEHLNYLAGPSEVYHLSVEPVGPDFSLLLGLDQIAVTVGGEGRLPIVGLTATNGFKAPIELTVTGADGLTGKATIPAGAKLSPTAPVWITVKAEKNAKPGAAGVRVVATAEVGGRTVVHLADQFDAAKAALGGMPNPPIETTTQVGVAVISGS